MKVIKLPNDCIYELLNFLNNDRSTLFTCLLVNRFWCGVTVPLLYANPFENLNKKHNYSIISTLINFLNNKETSYLQKILSCKTIITANYKPLFDYPKYIKVFDKNIRKSVLNWLKYQKIDLNDERNDNIVSVFHHMLLRQCKNIKQMKISSTSLIRNIFNNQFVEDHISNLSNLDSIKFIFGGDLNNKLFLEFLQRFPNICSNLKHLQFNIDKYNSVPLPAEKLCSIIRQQRNLETFKISNDETRTFNFRTANSQNILLNNILLSLEFKKHSLVLLDFLYINFKDVSFKKLANLSNLKYLKFRNCKKISLSHCEDLKYSSFKLKELSIQSAKLEPEVKISMIGCLGGSLRRLIAEKPTIPIIEAISSYCLDLETLDIRINSRVNLSVFPYFKNLGIKNLNLNISYVCMDNIFRSLAKSLPTNVKLISIRNCRSSNKFDSKLFLDNVHGDLDTINQNDTNLLHLETILNYIERNNNRLKCLGIKTLGKTWNEEELNLLNKIKDKGVKVVEFNSIYKESDFI